MEQAKRKDFLRGLKSQGKSRKYKRYPGLPLRYAGGKSLAVGHVLEQMDRLPKEPESLVSPFLGGGSVEIACAKELGIQVQAYDVFGILTAYWQEQLQHPEALAKRIHRWRPTPGTYSQVKQALKAHWTGEKRIRSRRELAAHYWFNHNLSYGPGFLGWMSKIYEDPDRFQRMTDKVKNFRCPGLTVSPGDFQDTLPRHAGTLLYCDPPYYLDGDSQMFRGIYPQRNFPVHHQGFNHAALRDLLKKHAGGFILSYNDCSTIRNWYSGCTLVEVEWQYTLGQGETRIGKNRSGKNRSGKNRAGQIGKNRTHVKESHELIIIRA